MTAPGRRPDDRAEWGPPHWSGHGQWPRGGPPHWQGGRTHRGPPPGFPFWRRRFLRWAITIGVIWIAMGFAFGFAFRGNRDEHGNTAGPPIILIMVIVAVVATAVAYRRLARPMSGLLDGASRIGSGQYDARVRPEGPRSVRTLGYAFNDMAARLDASETARRRFLADVTHELRTPLTVLQGGVEAQIDGVHPRDDEHLTTLLEQTRTLARLVEDLRTLALGDAGQLTITAAPTSLAGVIDDAVSAIRPMATTRSVAITVTTGSAVIVPADRVRLVQVLTNLLTNAVRHTPAGGTVTVTLQSTAPTATITVDDTGPGITGEPERVFDRFHRSADSGGTGLGLTIARQLVDAHGGTIAAGNRAEGGARFTVTLPAETDA